MYQHEVSYDKNDRAKLSLMVMNSLRDELVYPQYPRIKNKCCIAQLHPL